VWEWASAPAAWEWAVVSVWEWALAPAASGLERCLVEFERMDIPSGQATTLTMLARAYDGSHRYVLTFPKGLTPPVQGFWSITMYDDKYFFVDNPMECPPFHRTRRLLGLSSDELPWGAHLER